MKIGLALSGGGAKGIAHLGVIKALNEKNIEFSEISGTSAGSIAAAFIVNGFDPEEVLGILQKTNLLKMIWPAFSVKGLLSLDKSEKIYTKYFPNDDFNDCKIKLNIAATNLNTGKAEYFSTGSLSKAIMASSCIPFLFSPISIGQYLYVDGGVLNNLPVEAIRDKCDYVIGVNVSPVIEESDFGGTKELIERVGILAISSNVVSSQKKCDLFLEPSELRDFGTFDFKRSQEIFDIGYEHTMHHLSLLEKDDALFDLINNS